MKIELCDLCKTKAPNKKFKVKMSRKGRWQCTEYLVRWVEDLWRPYEKIAICEDCYNKLVHASGVNL